MFEAGSFRDRSARILYDGGSVLRIVDENALRNFRFVAQRSFFQKALESGDIVATEESPERPPAGWAGVLTHEKIPFISYPYEWSFSMLKDAALLQLRLLRDALSEEVTLKDATPFNIQWRGVKPVFIDIPSFEPLEPGAFWTGYRQFCELFLFPLMLQAYKGVSFHPLLRGDIDGIAPREFMRLFSLRDLFQPGVFKHVYLHGKFEQACQSSHTNVGGALKSAGFQKELILANVNGLLKLIERMAWSEGESEWSHYAEKRESYTEGGYRTKVEFVESVVSGRECNLIWDLGANTGAFSRLVARRAKTVVSADADHLAIDRLYRALRQEKSETILPLVLNLRNPSPALGWRGLERKRLEERGKPDLILCLALIHHLVISANIPLKEVIEWLAGVTGELVIEFVDRTDPMVVKLLINRVDQYPEYTREGFERILAGRFRVVRSEVLPTRVLYHAVAPQEGSPMFE